MQVFSEKFHNDTVKLSLKIGFALDMTAGVLLSWLVSVIL